LTAVEHRPGEKRPEQQHAARVAIGQKMRQHRDTLAPQFGVAVNAIEATAECETDARGLLGMDSVAPHVRNVALTIAIQSPADEDAVRRVYQAWQERCPVYLALTKALPVATTLDFKRT
jgi:uncharacterized OsmC-like protein